MWALMIVIAIELPGVFTDQVTPTEVNRFKSAVQIEVTRQSAYDDTLSASVDSLAAYDDTLTAEIDTIGMAFFAVDSVGGQSVTGVDSSYIALDTERLEDAIYTHEADGYAVGIAVAGVYLVSYSLSAYCSGDDDIIWHTNLDKYSSGWDNPIVGSFSYGTIQGTLTNGHATTAVSVIEQFVAGDSIAILLVVATSSVSATLDPASANLSIVRIQ